MLYACAARFDVTGNFEIFLKGLRRRRKKAPGQLQIQLAQCPPSICFALIRVYHFLFFEETPSCKQSKKETKKEHPHNCLVKVYVRTQKQSRSPCVHRVHSAAPEDQPSSGGPHLLRPPSAILQVHRGPSAPPTTLCAPRTGRRGGAVQTLLAGAWDPHRTRWLEKNAKAKGRGINAGAREKFGGKEIPVARSPPPVPQSRFRRRPATDFSRPRASPPPPPPPPPCCFCLLAVAGSRCAATASDLCSRGREGRRERKKRREEKVWWLFGRGE